MTGAETTSGLITLRPGQRPRGLVPGQAVTVIAIEVMDPTLAEVFYRDESGTSGGCMVTEADVANLEPVGDLESVPAFDGDPDEFRLAARALRIKYAVPYDPMAVVNNSDVDPLPHQIRAVYEELLPRLPLRFLLADDPSAGKTIMADLYIKELILRSNCGRAIVVVPDGLAEQWCEELVTKFDLYFEAFNRQMIDDAHGRDIFADRDRLIARMDQTSRNEDLMEQLSEVNWDVAVVDEAHRMSAHYSSWAGEMSETKHFRLGRLLSETAHSLLLMTATLYTGEEEDFQLFMSLLDRDRFEGQYRQGVHRTDAKGLMRRMVKEDLLTFEGKPLFPERRAYTAAYEPSPAERELYDLVTEYVCTEIRRAEHISQAGDRRRGNSAGFALTVLQRHLAPNPEVILRSLERRQRRLEDRPRELTRIQETVSPAEKGQTVARFDTQLLSLSIHDYEDMDLETTDSERLQFEIQMEYMVDRAAAAQTIPKLRAEIAILEDLIRVAYRIRRLDDDEKWMQLRAILDEQLLADDDIGAAREIIIFTEHRGTLDYSDQRISAQLDRSDVVVRIHDGTSREERMAAREKFTHDPDMVALLATDAAGEGLNLQRVYLMVNYDLPWNPNRIEQRFGRIHRIGQREVCHLWDTVAKDTREDDVFMQLLSKTKQISVAYNRNLFNVLGNDDTFQERSLRDLLIEAIRYGDRPEVKAKLDRIINAGVRDGLDGMLTEKALHPEMFSAPDLDEVRAKTEKVRERRLQPGYIAAFLLPAFERLGGQACKREKGRYEITRVFTWVIDIARCLNRWAPVADQYEHITFELHLTHPEGQPPATLIAPGQPLLRAVIEATIEDLGSALRHGTVLVDRRNQRVEVPALIYTVEQRIINSAPGTNTVSHHFDYPILEPDETVTVSATPPYLDYDAPQPGEAAAIASIPNDEWVKENHEKAVRANSYHSDMQPRMEEIRARLEIEMARTCKQVREQLFAEINHRDREYNRLEDLERVGTIGRVWAETAHAKVRQLEKRLERRRHELVLHAKLVAIPGMTRSAALIVPGRLIEAESGQEVPARTRATEEVGRRAVEAVLAAERVIGKNPVEMPRNNLSYDIRSTDDEGRIHYVGVKSRIEGTDTFTIMTNEVTFAQTQDERHRLTPVQISPDGPEHDELCYVTDAFVYLEPSTITRFYNEEWRDYWNRGGPPR